MFARKKRRLPVSPTDGVSWASEKWDNFSTPFTVSAHSQKLWIHAEGWPPSELRLKGSNWAGFQADGCVHELWKHGIDEYVGHLVRHGFNAVRLPCAAFPFSTVHANGGV